MVKKERERERETWIAIQKKENKDKEECDDLVVLETIQGVSSVFFSVLSSTTIARGEGSVIHIQYRIINECR